MESTPDIEIPTPPVQSKAQTTPSLSDNTSVAIAQRTISQDFLGQNLTADISRLVQEEGKVVFQPIAAAAFNALYTSACDARSRAEARLEVEQERNRAITAREANATKRAAVLQARLYSSRESASLRNVGYALGGAAIAFIPFAVEKATWIGGVIAAVFGLALLLSAIFIKSKPENDDVSSNHS